MYQTDTYEDHEKKRVSAQLQSKVLHATLVCLRSTNAYAREMKHQGHEGRPFWEPDSKRSVLRIYQSSLSRNILNLHKVEMCYKCVRQAQAGQHVFPSQYRDSVHQQSDRSCLRHTRHIHQAIPSLSSEDDGSFQYQQREAARTRDTVHTFDCPRHGRGAVRG